MKVCCMQLVLSKWRRTRQRSTASASTPSTSLYWRPAPQTRRCKARQHALACMPPLLDCCQWMLRLGSSSSRCFLGTANDGVEVVVLISGGAA